MSFHEDGRARRLPDPETMSQEPAFKSNSKARAGEALAARSGIKRARKLEVPAKPSPEEKQERVSWSLNELNAETFRSQTDPQKKHEMLVAMIVELDNEEHAENVKDSLFKTIIAILKDIDEPTNANAIIMQARASRERSLMGKLINRLPDKYRVTLDTAYITARHAAGVGFYSPKHELKAGEHSIVTPPPIEKTPIMQSE